MISEFLSWLNQTVMVSTPTGLDMYGQVSYGTAAAVKCYIDYTSKKVLSQAGEEVVSSAIIYLPGCYSSQTKIAMPDGSNPTVLNAKIIANEQGNLEMTLLYVGA